MTPMLSRIQGQPILVEEGHGAWLESCLSAVAQHEDLKAASAQMNEDFWDERFSWARPYVVKQGILHVPVKGVLLNDFPYAFGGWATGYEYIWAAVKRGLEDSNVKGIALVINSGGGMVSGNWDLVDRISASRGVKPIQAFAAEHAYSAAYNIAAAAEHITVGRTGGVGSIGVVITHFEISNALEKNGVTVNLIRSKQDKMEGNPYEALSKGARARMQADVDELHSQFVAMVAANRGMSEADVDATDAHTFMPKQAIENGLADAIGALDDAITAFEASFTEGEEPMATENQAVFTEETHAAAVIAARAEGVSEERARVTGILGSEEAKDRPAAAMMMVNLGVSAEQASVELAKLPSEKAAQTVTDAPSGAGVPNSLFQAAMNGTENPGIEAESGEKPKPLSRVQRAMSLVHGD